MFLFHIHYFLTYLIIGTGSKLNALQVHEQFEMLTFHIYIIFLHFQLIIYLLHFLEFIVVL